jgi:aminoglycoside 3-N-acetyltransferase
MIEFRDLVVALGELDIHHTRPVIAHASLSAFGRVRGGAAAVVEALLYRFDTLVMPAFTYKTMIVPRVAPPQTGMLKKGGINNGAPHSRARYTSHWGNQPAQAFHPALPIDRLIGAIPEALRQHPKAGRSTHPILSFTGVNAWPILGSQSIEDPLAPIHMLTREDGVVLLLGVGHSVNTSIHYAERLAKRKQFIRWALTEDGIAACPRFPGCSYGFDAIAPLLTEVTRWGQAGSALIQAIPLVALIRITQEIIKQDPLALLCSQPECGRCRAVREHVAWEQS